MTSTSTTDASTTADPHAPTRLPTAPLVCTTIATVLVTALALVVSGGALAWLSSGGTAADRAMGTLLVVIGLAFLGTPAVLMWVALTRLFTQPPRGAMLMIGCLRAMGGFVLIVALPTLRHSGSLAVIGAAIGIALAFIGTARMLASATGSP